MVYWCGIRTFHPRDRIILSETRYSLVSDDYSGAYVELLSPTPIHMKDTLSLPNPLAFRSCCFILDVCSFPVWCLGQDVNFDLSVPGAPFTKLFMTELIHKTQFNTHFCPKLCSNFITLTFLLTL